MWTRNSFVGAACSILFLTALPTHAESPVPEVHPAAATSAETGASSSLADRVRALKSGTPGSAPAAADPHGVPAAVAAETASPPPAAHGGHAGWGYAGDNGPERWGDLAADYEVCGKGVEQSPIDLSNPAIRGEVDIAFDYHPSVLQVLNNGHTFQVAYGAGSAIAVAGERFELQQFHFHAPSEHARDGRRFPMEVHLVHKNAAGRLAVVGVLIESGAENIAMMEMWDRMPMQAGAAELVARVAINAADLVPNGTRFYRYMGSLTTPPCSEGVNWFVADQTIEASTAQVGKFLQAVGENARPLQALNNRLLGGPPHGN